MRKLQYYIIILFLLPWSTIIAQVDHLSFEPEENYRLNPSDVSQTEVFIVNSPLNRDVLFSSCNTLTFIPFFISEGIYVTTDGGTSWYGNDTCTGEPMAFHGGDPGIAIDKDGAFIITRLGRSPFTGLYSHYSTDQGQTWSAQQVISTDDLERASVATDYFPGSPYYGRTYAVWVKFAPPFPLMMAYTDDSGISWTGSEQINNPPNRSAGGDICIGPNGEVYVCWAGVTDVSPFKEIYVGFASSKNGGADWHISEEAFSMNGITGLLPDKGNIRVNGLPGIAVDTASGEKNGWIYIVSGQKGLLPAGSDPDIILNRSEDGGLSWSSGIRVNRDAPDNGKTQYFPSVHVDKFGAVDIIFYDDRNTTIDSAGVFLARTDDGGNSWKEYEISDHNYKPEPIGGLGQGYQGDNIDLTSTDTRLCPVWMDNSSGTYQIWTSPIEFSTLDFIGEGGQKKVVFELRQNCPNPFHQHSNILIKLTDPAMVELKVFDIQGKESAVLTEGYKSAGEYEFQFEANKAGIYICILRIDNRSRSIKMVALP
ncbi:MAG: T9SS type A sorting domain-containing protein [Bacteroidales bacterium]|nr:T9SS type A sorting domain-containing protein [Bacteroidales bacterium]